MFFLAGVFHTLGIWRKIFKSATPKKCEGQMNLLYLLFPFIVKYQETILSEKHLQHIMMRGTERAQKVPCIPL